MKKPKEAVKVGDQWVSRTTPLCTPSPPGHPDYLSQSALAKWCGVSYGTILRWVEKSEKSDGTIWYRGQRWFSPEDAKVFINKAIANTEKKKTKWRPLS